MFNRNLAVLCSLLALVPVAHGASRLNASKLNGDVLNGMSLQGIRLQGMRMQGMSMQGMRLQGTQLVSTLDGQPVTVAAGDVLELITADGHELDVHVDGVEDRDGLTWYQLSLDGQPVCANGGPGLFVGGVWDATGERHDSLWVGEVEVDTSLSCTDGVIAKCVDWGYRPWEVGPDAHQACTRAARADVCGDGVPWTEDGTLIDVVDDLGVMPFEGYGHGEGLGFEAGWTPDGAVCARKVRYMDVPDGGPECLDELPLCATWDQALDEGAWIGTSSKTQVRH